MLCWRKSRRAADPDARAAHTPQRGTHKELTPKAAEDAVLTDAEARALDRLQGGDHGHAARDLAILFPDLIGRHGPMLVDGEPTDVARFAGLAEGDYGLLGRARLGRPGGRAENKCARVFEADANFSRRAGKWTAGNATAPAPEARTQTIDLRWREKLPVPPAEGETPETPEGLQIRVMNAWSTKLRAFVEALRELNEELEFEDRPRPSRLVMEGVPSVLGELQAALANTHSCRAKIDRKRFRLRALTDMPAVDWRGEIMTQLGVLETLGCEVEIRCSPEPPRIVQHFPREAGRMAGRLEAQAAAPAPGTGSYTARPKARESVV